MLTNGYPKHHIANKSTNWQACQSMGRLAQLVAAKR